MSEAPGTAPCSRCKAEPSIGNTFMCGSGGLHIEHDDLCHTCRMEDMRRLPRRLTRAFRASGLTGDEAEALTGVEAGWFEESAAHPDCLYGFQDAHIHNEDCGVAVAKLLAVARKRRGPGTAPKVVVLSDYRGRRA